MGYSVYTINFLNAIGVHEIPQFRGAVISTVGRDNNLLFHNHKGGWLSLFISIDTI